MKCPPSVFPPLLWLLVLGHTCLLSDASAQQSPRSAEQASAGKRAAVPRNTPTVATVRPVWSNQKGKEINLLSGLRSTVRPVWSDREGRKFNLLRNTDNPVRPLRSTVHYAQGYAGQGDEATTDRGAKDIRRDLAAGSTGSYQNAMDRLFGAPSNRGKPLREESRNSSANSLRLHSRAPSRDATVDVRSLTFLYRSLTEGEEETKTSTMRHDGTTTHRDSHGRETGRSTSQFGGTVVHRDSHGRETGRSTRQLDGTVVHRDSHGRETGRSTGR